jgi:hypothetical protein
MTPQTLDLLKLMGSFAGGATGAVSGALLKQWFDQRDVRATQRQTRWLPLLEATRELKHRFEALTARYQPYRAKQPPELPSLAYDFWELYTLDKERKSFGSLEDPGLEAVLDASRENASAVQRVRRRMSHQLNYAASSLYMTAKYLGYAERMLRELKEHRLLLPRNWSIGPRKAMQCEMIRLLSEVREQLQGVSKEHPGAGVIFEQQESIAESVWGLDNRVITSFEFRQRLLLATGWEQFTGLFRFFVHFHEKMDTEVARTIQALEALCRALERVRG